MRLALLEYPGTKNQKHSYVIQNIHACNIPNNSFPGLLVTDFSTIKINKITEKIPSKDPPMYYFWSIIQRPDLLQQQKASLSITLWGSDTYKITQNAHRAFLENCGELCASLIDGHTGSIAANGTLVSIELFIQGFWVTSFSMSQRGG